MVLANDQPIGTDAQTLGDLDMVLAELAGVLDEEPLKDGITHRAEQTIGAHLQLFVQSDPEQLVGKLFQENPELCASVIRCLGRCPTAAWPEPGPPSSWQASWLVSAGSNSIGRSADWRRELLRQSLASIDVLLRDAAIQAVEEWEDPTLLPVLQEHDEPQLWLREYLDAVVADIAR